RCARAPGDILCQSARRDGQGTPRDRPCRGLHGSRADGHGPAVDPGAAAAFDRQRPVAERHPACRIGRGLVHRAEGVDAGTACQRPRSANGIAAAAGGGGSGRKAPGEAGRRRPARRSRRGAGRQRRENRVRLAAAGTGPITREIQPMQMPGEMGPVHILGIGGIGMSAIAEILHAKGYTVQGSDQKSSANVKRLRAKGIRVFVGHDPINLVGARYVVISTAVKKGNPELEAARAKGLPIIRRAEMLAELMRLYATVSVTGTHGKTTTTSLIAHIYNSAGLDPTVITGGIINEWGSNARRGEGPWMIVEADESDGTFIKIPTQIGVVTNIDPEHLDYFETVENMHRAYEAFFRGIPFYGLAVACIDHPVVSRLIERLQLRRDGRRLLTYGTTPGADLLLKAVHAEGATTVFDAQLGPRVRGGQRPLNGWSIPMAGHHNALNALAAIAAASEAGIPDAAIRSALAG